MEWDFSPALRQLENTVEGLIGLLPGIVVGSLIFFVFLLISRFAAHWVQRLAARYRRQRNVGVVLGRLLQWIVLLIGLLVAAVVIFPNFTPTRMIEFMGIGSVAIGFAFRDILQNFLAG